MNHQGPRFHLKKCIYYSAEEEKKHVGWHEDEQINCKLKFLGELTHLASAKCALNV